MCVVKTGLAFNLTLMVSPRSTASRVGDTKSQVTVPSVVVAPMVVFQAGGVVPDVPATVTRCRFPLESRISAPTAKGWVELHAGNREPVPVGTSLQVTVLSPTVAPTTAGQTGGAAP